MHRLPDRILSTNGYFSQGIDTTHPDKLFKCKGWNVFDASRTATFVGVIPGQCTLNATSVIGHYTTAAAQANVTTALIIRARPGERDLPEVFINKRR